MTSIEPLGVAAGAPGDREAAPPLRVVWLGRIAYAQAWVLQRRLAAARRAGSIDDCLLLLEHPPVYTLGRSTDPAHVPGGQAALRALGADVHVVDRGGSVTFHGPGQLVGYPIVDLAAALPVAGHPTMGDVGAYLRMLEAVLCATAAWAGVAASPRPPFTGAWVGDEKVAAIGVKLSAGVTQHGVALNVDTDLAWFAAVVPCGIPASLGGVTTLRRAGGRAAPLERLAGVLATELARRLGRRPAPADGSLDRLLAD